MKAIPSPARNDRRLIVRLVLIAAGAFAFAFALVPLYNVFCEATGLNGKTRDGFGIGGIAAQEVPTAVDVTRIVRVEFMGTVMPGLAWEIRPLTPSIDLHPGELQTVRYLVRNVSNETLVGRAIPSVSPGQAARHFQKLECFCYQEQRFAPGEARELPLAFIIQPEIDPKLSEITLSYAFYPSTQQEAP